MYFIVTVRHPHTVTSHSSVCSHSLKVFNILTQKNHEHLHQHPNNKSCLVYRYSRPVPSCTFSINLFIKYTVSQSCLNIVKLIKSIMYLLEPFYLLIYELDRSSLGSLDRLVVLLSRLTLARGC